VLALVSTGYVRVLATTVRSLRADDCLKQLLHAVHVPGYPAGMDDIWSRVATPTSSLLTCSLCLFTDRVCGARLSTWTPPAYLRLQQPGTSVRSSLVAPSGAALPATYDLSSFHRFYMYQGPVNKNDLYTALPFNDSFYGAFGTSMHAEKLYLYRFLNAGMSVPAL